MSQPAAISSFLNQIFYKNNKFDDNNIDQLNCWMLSKDDFTKTNVVETPKINVVETQPEVVIDIDKKPQMHNNKNKFSPKKQDSLFWCAYAAHHGESAYWIIGNKYKNTEIEEKQAMIEYIKTNSAKIRGESNPKITQVRLQEIMSNLMMNKKTDWYTFHIMCMFYNIRVYVIFDKTFLDFNNSSSTSTFIFDYSKDGHISINYENDHILEKLVKLEYMSDRPIKSITNYKLSELLEMADKLEIGEPETGKTKPKKLDWYNAIVKKCTW